ncbi:MAG: hypothetical protein OHK0053_31930 [Microscillaceae bacterium]
MALFKNLLLSLFFSCFFALFSQAQEDTDHLKPSVPTDSDEKAKVSILRKTENLHLKAKLQASEKKHQQASANVFFYSSLLGGVIVLQFIFGLWWLRQKNRELLAAKKEISKKNKEILAMSQEAIHWQEKMREAQLENEVLRYQMQD